MDNKIKILSADKADSCVKAYHPIGHSNLELMEIKNGTPHCKKHGAMNKITTEEDGGGFWRCITVSGYKRVKKGNSEGLQHMETICRAGCLEVRHSFFDKTLYE